MAEQVGISFGGDSAEARRAIERIIRELDKLSRHAAVSSAAMTKALGGVSSEFSRMSGVTNKNTQDLERNRIQVDNNTSSFSRFSRQIIVANQGLALMGKAIGVLKWPTMIAAAGAAAQALNALVAGAVALGGALSSLSGLLGAIPAAIITLGGAAITAKLAFAGLKEALDGNREAFNKLTPEGKQFVSVLNGLKPVIKDLRQSAQQGLFPGLTEGLESIFNVRNIAIFRNALRGFGKAMGDTFAQLGRLVGTSGFAKDMNFLLESAAKNLRIVGGAAVNVIDGFRNIAVAAQPLVDWLVQLIRRFGEWFKSATEVGRATGGLSRFFAETKQTLQELGNILGPVGRALINIFKVAAPFGHELLRLLGGAAKQLQAVTESASGESAIKKYFADAMPVLIEMGRLVRDVVGVFLRLGATPELTNLLSKLRTELLPILERVLSTALSGFGDAVADLAIEIAKLLEYLLTASGPLTNFIKALDGILSVINFLIDTVPGAKDVLVAFLGVLAIAKITGIAGAIAALGKAWYAQQIAATTAATVTTRATLAIKAALISTGIGALLVAIGIAAQVIIMHWDKVGPYFKAIFTIIVESAKAAAYLITQWLLFPLQAFLKAVSLVPDWVPIFGGLGDSASKALGVINAAVGKLKPDLDAVHDATLGLAGGFDTAEKSGVDAANNIGLAFSATTGQVVQMAADVQYAWEVAAGAMAPQIGLAPGVTGGAKGAQAGAGTAVQKVLQFAQQYGVGSGITYPQSGPGGVVGVPKVGIESGFDCSGYVASSLLAAGIRVPHNAAQQFQTAPIQVPRGQEQPGDAVYFVSGGSAGAPGHCGLYVGGGYFIEYFSHGKPARRSLLKNRSDYVGARRWIKVSAQTAGVAGAQLGGPGAFVPTPTTPSATGFTPTTPTFAETGGTTPPTRVEKRAFREEVDVFERGVKRILDPGIERQVRQQLAKIRKLLAGPVTAEEMEKAKKLFEDMKTLYSQGMDLNPIVQKLNQFDQRIGRFAGLPKTQAAIRAGVERTRDLISKFRKDSSEDGILLSDAEQKQIERSFGKVQEAVTKGLQLRGIRQWLGDFGKMIGEWRKMVLRELGGDETSTEILARVNDLRVKIAEAAAAGNVKLANQLKAQVATLGDAFRSAWRGELDTAKGAVTSALDNVGTQILSAFDKQTQRLIKAAEDAVSASFGVIRGQTAASRTLQEFRAGREARAFAKTVAEANEEMAEAERKLQQVRGTPGVTPEEVKEAEERVLSARERIYELGLDAQEKALQQQADAAEAAYADALQAAREQVESEREIQRASLDRRLSEIKQFYAEGKLTAEEANAAILSLLGEYDIGGPLATATDIFVESLNKLAGAIAHLANVLRSAREMSTPSSSGPGPSSGGPARESGGDGAYVAYIPLIDRPSGGAMGVAQYGGIVPSRGLKVSRDHLLVAASPGEVILNEAQQKNLLANMGGGGTPIIVQINRPLLLGRSLAVADQIAESVAPAINRRIGYRY